MKLEGAKIIVSNQLIMKLHQNKEVFKETIMSTAKYFDIYFGRVESDYWITYVLNNIALSKHQDIVVLARGTAISKGFNTINLFLVDIDLEIIQPEQTPTLEVKNLLHEIEIEITTGLSEKIVTYITNIGPDFRNTVFEYSSLIDNSDFGMVNNQLLIEIKSNSTPNTFKKMPIQSFITEYLLANGHIKEIDLYEMKPFYLNTLIGFAL